jgi:hypothetical protein
LHVQLLERVHGLVSDRSVGGFLQPQVEPLGRRIPRFMIQFSCFSGVRCGFADGAAHPLIPDSLISFVFFHKKASRKIYPAYCNRLPTHALEVSVGMLTVHLACDNLRNVMGLWFMVWYQIGVWGGVLAATGFAVGAAHPQFRDPECFGVVFCGFADGVAHPQFQMPVLPLCSKAPGKIILPGGLVLDLF